MPLAANLQSHDYSFDLQVPQGVWRWTTRMNISGPSPVYEIRDIISPFGVFRDSIPIPGVVAQAMGDSISELQAQFPPSILIGPPASLSFTVDEGRGVSAPLSASITNNGIFGSLLDVSLTSSAPYVSVAPATLGGLVSQESGSFDVSVDSTTLLPGVFNATVLVQDSTAVNNPQNLPVTITVRPKATVSVSPLTLNFSVVKPLTGAFPPIPTQVFTIENTGPVGSVLEFLVQRLTCLSENWLVSFSPFSGSLNSGQTQNVTVNVAPAQNLTPGTYEETLRVSGYSTNSFVNILVKLVIS